VGLDEQTSVNKYRDHYILKALQIGAGLISNPGSIPYYVSTRNQTPLEQGLPWISFGAIHFLDSFLKPNMRVFEYGSGGSTIYFSRRCESVISIEDSDQWIDQVSKKLEEMASFNVRLCFHATDKAETTDNVDFQKSKYLKAIDDQNPDILFIDGSDEWTLPNKRRSICFRYAEPIMKQGSIIIVDDSWAYPELRSRNRAKRVKTFWGFGPCRTGVTSTDVFFF
jgi:hypothetical protein